MMIMIIAKGDTVEYIVQSFPVFGSRLNEVCESQDITSLVCSN